MANTYTLIEAKTLTTTAASVTFSSIPATYTDLKLVMSLRITTGDPNTNLTFTPSGGTYSDKVLFGYSSTAGSNSTSNIRAGQVNADANMFNNVEIYIPNYASSNTKSVSVDAVTEVNGTTNLLSLTAGLWSGTSAITGIVLTPVSSTYTQYSTFYLYGIKNS
jgi:hypothetical protein